MPTTPADEKPVPIEFLYGIQAGRYDGNDDWKPAHTVRFRITKKTTKRIYYVARDWAIRPEIRFVDRQRIEADGEIYQRSRHWSEPDKHLYLADPVVEQAAPPKRSSPPASTTSAPAPPPDRPFGRGPPAPAGQPRKDQRDRQPPPHHR